MALRDGPLIYCAETVDQKVDNVLSPTSALTTEWESDLLHGVTVIKGTWADGSAMTAIPYYARDNRGTGAANGGDEQRSIARGRRRRPLSSSVWLKDR